MKVICSLEGEGLAAAVGRFPRHVDQIRSLMERDENFRIMCEDLASAERAVLAVNHLSSAVRDERRQEFLQLAHDLATEIQRTLSQIKFIPFRR